MIDFDKLWEEYKKEVELHSKDYFKADKTEFFKMCIFYELLKRKELEKIKGKLTVRGKGVEL